MQRETPHGEQPLLFPLLFSAQTPSLWQQPRSLGYPCTHPTQQSSYKMGFIAFILAPWYPFSL